MHDEAAFGTHAVLVQVEPGLSAEQVADLDEAKQAVIIAVRGRQRRKPGCRMQAERENGRKRGQHSVGPPGERRCKSLRHDGIGSGHVQSGLCWEWLKLAARLEQSVKPGVLKACR